MTAMTAQISAMRITWPVLTDLVLVIREARNDPRSSTALGATPLAGQDCSITAVAPMPSPTEPRPMARFAHADRLSWRAGWMPRCASGSHLLVDLQADPLDQPFGHRAVIRLAELGMRARRRGNVLLCQLIHAATLHPRRSVRQQ